MTSLHVSQNQLSWTLPLSCWNTWDQTFLYLSNTTTRHSLCRGGKSDSQRPTAIFFHERLVHMLVDPTWVVRHQNREGKELSTTMFTSYPKYIHLSKYQPQLRDNFYDTLYMHSSQLKHILSLVGI